MDVIKVRAVSRTAAVAGAVAGVIRDEKHAEIQAIGAGAVNQAIKAMVLAKNFLDQDGIDIAFVPEFVNVEIDGKSAQRSNLLLIPNSVPLNQMR